MAKQCFDRLLSDDELRVLLERGEQLVFTAVNTRVIERQIERLGFDDAYFVTQVEAGRGKVTRVTPITPQSEFVRDAA